MKRVEKRRDEMKWNEMKPNEMTLQGKATSAAFAEASKHYNAMRLIGVGLAIWTSAVVICAASPGFYTLLISRALMGAGEASFLALTAPFIDDVAPPKSKTVWFAMFYMTNTAGFALGYMVGGILGPVVGWR
eukprot:scaffold256547_cov25-Prasinocladus_malaysianus.AAC.2